jgi:hypothetical protein
MLVPDPDRAVELAERERLYRACRDLKQKNYDDVVLPDLVAPVQDHKGKRLPRVKVEPKPRPPKMHRIKVAVPVISAQGRSGRPNKGQSRQPQAAELSETYLRLGLSDTARHYGVSRQSIINWLNAYVITRQGKTEASEERRKAAAAASWTR